MTNEQREIFSTRFVPFMEEFMELCDKYGTKGFYGCGCCGSPSLLMKDADGNSFDAELLCGEENYDEAVCHGISLLIDPEKKTVTMGEKDGNKE